MVRGAPVVMDGDGEVGGVVGSVSIPNHTNNKE